MEIVEIKKFIESKLSPNLPSHIFLDKMRVIEESSRKSFAYNEYSYVPLYYWLGEIFKVETLVEVGFGLGLLSGNYLKTCKTVKRFLALHELRTGEYYSHRLGKSNIKDNYKGYLYIHVGKIDDDIFETKLKTLDVGLAIINEENTYDRHRLYYDLLWPQMNKDGLVVIDYLNKHKQSAVAFKDFCKSKNIEPTYINTSYGVGLIKKG